MVVGIGPTGAVALYEFRHKFVRTRGVAREFDLISIRSSDIDSRLSPPCSMDENFGWRITNVNEFWSV